MVSKAQKSGLIIGLAGNLIPNGVVLLQYTDDTIVCLRNDLEGARNMKLLLYVYELMSGMKINFSKSEIITIHGDNELDKPFADLFNCQIGKPSIKYLGVRVSSSRLHVRDWDPLVEKNAKNLSAWKGGSMSIARRTTMITANLSSSFIYHMSIYLLPKTITNKLDSQRRSFLWQGGSQKKKYHLVKWSVICKSKQKGGLSIKDIQKMKISLLCK